MIDVKIKKIPETKKEQEIMDAMIEELTEQYGGKHD